jgi:hypothetical protein
VSAISSADSGGPSTIVLGAGCTYTLTQVTSLWYGADGLPPISAAITIDGNGATIAAEPSPGSPPFRFFYVGADPNSARTLGYTTPGAGSLTLDDLTLSGGLAEGGSGGPSGGGGAGMGGAIFNQGTLTLDAVTLSGNQALGGSGGAVQAGQVGGGGGMSGDGTTSFGGGAGPASGPGGGARGDMGGGGGGGGFVATPLICVFPPCPGDVGGNGSGPSGGNGGGSPNGTGGANGTTGGGGLSGDGSGGGGYSLGGTGGAGGSFGVGGSTSGMGGAGGGGGVGGGGAPTGPIGPTGAGGGFGGGGGAGDLEGGAGGFGGGEGGSLRGYACACAASFGGGLAGGNGMPPGGAGGGGAGLGGAIFNHQGTVTITNSTLASNRAAGGGGAHPGQGFGGAIFNLNGQVTLSSATLAQNAASTDGGALYNLAYDSATSRTATVTLSNSIMFGSTDGAGQPVSDLFAAQPLNVATGGGGGSNESVTSTDASAHDIVGRVGTAGLTAVTGSPSGADPGLGPLRVTGGPGMATMAIGGGSPAVGTGRGCPPTDERGVRRALRACDAGAYQAVLPPRVAQAAATKVRRASAVLRATVIPGGRDTKVSFRYGRARRYARTTKTQDVGAGTAAVTVTARILGLRPDTRYHFEVIAINPDGIVVVTHSFRTRRGRG